MAIASIWKIHSIERVLAGQDPLLVSNGTIAGITNVSMPVQANVTREVTGSNTFASSGRIDFTTVDLTFTSLMAQRMFELIPVRGACIAGGDTWNVYVAQYGCDGPLAGVVHRRYTIAKGMLYLTNVQADHAGDLQVSAQLQAVFDGTVPVSYVASNLPSATQIGDETGRWTISDKTTTNSAAVVNKRSVSVDMGVSTSTQGADSEAFDSFASIDTILPVVTVTGIDPTWFDSIGLTINGATVTHGNTKVGFRKRLNGGGFVADNVSAHITMSANGPAYYDQLFSSSGTDAGIMSYRLEPTLSSTNQEPLIFNTEQTI